MTPSQTCIEVRQSDWTQRVIWTARHRRKAWKWAMFLGAVKMQKVFVKWMRKGRKWNLKSCIRRKLLLLLTVLEDVQDCRQPIFLQECFCLLHILVNHILRKRFLCAVKMLNFPIACHLNFLCIPFLCDPRFQSCNWSNSFSVCLGKTPIGTTLIISLDPLQKLYRWNLLQRDVLALVSGSRSRHLSLYPWYRIRLRGAIIIWLYQDPF